MADGGSSSPRWIWNCAPDAPSSPEPTWAARRCPCALPCSPCFCASAASSYSPSPPPCPCSTGWNIILADSGPGAGGLSSFGKEVHLLDTLLRQTRDCFFFVAMDEFARGTNPQEGAALARALVRYLGTLDCVALTSATHYDGVSDVAGAHYRWPVWCGTSGSEGDDPRKRIARRMDYRLLRPAGDPCPRDALGCAACSSWTTP